MSKWFAPRSALGVELQLKTNKLILFPDSERMRTDDAIELKTPNALITAIGMEADNAHQSVRFLHQLRATINKKHRHNKTKAIA